MLPKVQGYDLNTIEKTEASLQTYGPIFNK